MSANTIVNQVTTTYQNNLTYFEKNQTELFYKITSLDFAIDAKHYKEKYALEYTDEGYFDVKELESGLFLYDEDSVAYAQSVVPPKEDICQIQKVIFFGTGLATHIPMIHQNIDTPSTYLIVEDDIELFRLSLFVVDYAQLAKSVSLSFSVMQNDEAFKDTFTSFYKKEESLNDFIQYFVFSSYYMQKSEEVKMLIEDLKVLSSST